jgi:hypothetical protein
MLILKFRSENWPIIVSARVISTFAPVKQACRRLAAGPDERQRPARHREGR